MFVELIAKTPGYEAMEGIDVTNQEFEGLEQEAVLIASMMAVDGVSSRQRHCRIDSS